MFDHPAIIEYLRNNILFFKINNDDFLNKVAEKLEKISIKKNNIVYQQGWDVDGLYLIISGQVQIYTERNNERYILSHADANHLVGEFLVLGDSIRSTSAEVVQDAELLFLSISDFHQLVQLFPELGSKIGARIFNRLCWNQTTLALRLCHLFVGLSEEVVRCLINKIIITSIPSNTFLFKQNEISDDLCIVIDGQFQINRSIDKSIETIAVIGRGETIGAIGVICQAPHEADVLAIRDSTIASLSRESYEKILQIYPLEINQTFVKSVISHLTKYEKPQLKSTETFVLAILSSHLSRAEIIQRLANALSQYGLTMILTSEIVDKAFSQKGAAQSSFQNAINHSLLQWLSEQEIAHRYIIYVIDETMTHWSRRCLRQADHIIFFSDFKENSAISSLEKAVLNKVASKGVKKTLLLNHINSSCVPLDSSRWLAPRTVDMYHHIREGKQSDFGRVARFLTGNTVGIVLGGGGARGFAHIGVIRAFHELDIPIDLIGGNSMGAVIAAQFAMQWGFKEMIEKTRQLCLKGDRFTLPIMSLFSGKRMTQGLREMFGQSCIEDLWLHYFSISCNISRASVMTHDTGPLLSAVLSSNAPPGLFPPQIIDGDILVDGALLNNVPVDVMAKYNDGGTIIAVDVNVREDLLNNTDNVGGMSGWNLLMNKINPIAEKIKRPNMIEILSRASMIGGLAQRKKMMDGIADLYLQPPVNEFSLMAYKDAEEIENLGYQYAKQELQLWLQNRTIG